jgi:hypothetical protein
MRKKEMHTMFWLENNLERENLGFSTTSRKIWKQTEEMARIQQENVVVMVMNHSVLKQGSSCSDD